MFAFEWPLMALLLPLPIIFWWLLPTDKNANYSNIPEILFPHISQLKKAFKVKDGNKIGKKNNIFFLILLTIFWLCLVFAVMRPVLVNQVTNIQRKGHDIMLAVDISGSMQALDFSTQTVTKNRLDVTKEVIGNFLQQRQSDRVGLILFGQHAYLQASVTFDTMSVGQMLNNALPGMAGFATAIGDAIGVAVRELKDRNENSRIVILLTDGTDNASNIPPIEAARIASRYGIRIYTVGIGKDGPVPFPDQIGRIIMAEVGMDEELLKEVATITGGVYFRATDDYSLAKIYNKINELEKIDLNIKEYQISQPLYRYPLGYACVLLFLLALHPIYRRVTYGF